MVNSSYNSTYNNVSHLLFKDNQAQEESDTQQAQQNVEEVRQSDSEETSRDTPAETTTKTKSVTKPAPEKLMTLKERFAIKLAQDSQAMATMIKMTRMGLLAIVACAVAASIVYYHLAPDAGYTSNKPVIQLMSPRVDYYRPRPSDLIPNIPKKPSLPLTQKEETKKPALPLNLPNQELISVDAPHQNTCVSKSQAPKLPEKSSESELVTQKTSKSILEAGSDLGSSQVKDPSNIFWSTVSAVAVLAISLFTFKCFTERQSEDSSEKNNSVTFNDIRDSAAPKDVYFPLSNWLPGERETDTFRKLVADENIIICARKSFDINVEDDDGHAVTKRVIIENKSMLAETIVYDENDLSSLSFKKGSHETKFNIFTEDTLNVLIREQKKFDNGKKSIGLDMANAYGPGGGYLKGQATQEEALCRRSNLYDALKNVQEKQNGSYSIPETGGIYCPHVQVFRDNKYYLLNDPIEVNLLAVAAYDLRFLGKHDYAKFDINSENDRTYEALKSNQKFVDATKKKLRHLLLMAAFKGHTHLVLGALGCGAFINPPQLIAEIFHELFDNEFKGTFEQVDFAILNLSNRDQNNIDCFRKIFEAPALSSSSSSTTVTSNAQPSIAIQAKKQIEEKEKRKAIDQDAIDQDAIEQEEIEQDAIEQEEIEQDAIDEEEIDEEEIDEEAVEKNRLAKEEKQRKIQELRALSKQPSTSNISTPLTVTPRVRALSLVDESHKDEMHKKIEEWKKTGYKDKQIDERIQFEAFIHKILDNNNLLLSEKILKGNETHKSLSAEDLNIDFEKVKVNDLTVVEHGIKTSLCLIDTLTASAAQCFIIDDRILVKYSKEGHDHMNLTILKKGQGEIFIQEPSRISLNFMEQVTINLSQPSDDAYVTIRKTSEPIHMNLIGSGNEDISDSDLKKQILLMIDPMYY